MQLIAKTILASSKEIMNNLKNNQITNMIIFITQKKSIKKKDNFQKKKSIYKPKPLKQRKSIKEDLNNQQSQITS